MKLKLVSLLLCVGMLFACNNTQKGAGIGAGGGALLGGIIGAIAGNTAVGVAVGGAVGAGAGAIIGNKMDKAKKQAQQVQNAQVETVKDTNGLDAVKVTFGANSVNNYLKSCGVQSKQIKSVEGQGSTNPVADNSTAAGRQQNRRVEVYMYASKEMIEKAEAGTLQ